MPRTVNNNNNSSNIICQGNSTESDGSTSTVFTPSDLDEVIAVWDADNLDNIVLSGNDISTWLDETGTYTLTNTGGNPKY